MPKATKYYTDEELDKKIEEMEAIKAERAKAREEKLNMAKIAYMDHLLEAIKDNNEKKLQLKNKIQSLKEKLSPRKEKKLIAAFDELLRIV